MNKNIIQIADRYHVTPVEIKSVIEASVFKNKPYTEAEKTTFYIMCNQYNLNPMMNEIHIWKSLKSGAIVIQLGIAGWTKLMNEHPDFEGLHTEFSGEGEDRRCTASIYKRNLKMPIVISEKLSECRQDSQPWRKFPDRMLRHKAIIQCVKVAFSISGLIDPDETDRYKEARVIEGATTAQVEELERLIKETYAKESLLAKWKEHSGAKRWGEMTSGQIIGCIVFLNDIKAHIQSIREVRYAGDGDVGQFALDSALEEADNMEKIVSRYSDIDIFRGSKKEDINEGEIIDE